MNQVLRKRLFPNRSICLRPPTPHAPNDIICECPMCNHFQHKKKLSLLETQEADYKKKLQTKLQSDFVSSSLNCDSNALEWLMNRLILPSHKIINRGIDIYIPQTLFYKDGEPVALFMNREIHDYKIKKVKREKINHTLIQKVMNERRRKYRDQVQILLGEKVLEKKKSLFAKKQQRIDTKDAAVIQFTDKSEQLITQNQLINLMLKRKQDSIWKKIMMIKNFVSSKQSSRLVKLSFIYTAPLYPQLFTRTKTLMLVYGDNIQAPQKEYISQTDEEKFCNELLKSSIEVFAEYYLYKIVSFVEYFYDDRIDLLECSILVNEFNRPYLLDIFKLQSKELVKYNWTQQQYRKRVELEENRIFKNDKQVRINPETQTIAKTLEECMYEKYLSEKDKNGLTLDPEDTTEQQNNDRFFAFLHPEFKHDLSHVLRTQNLSILEMKKKYLGYVEEKKPIVKPFASSFVKTLHSLTPRLRVSQPRQLMSSTLDYEKSPGRQTFRTRKITTPLSIQKRFRSANKSTLDYLY